MKKLSILLSFFLTSIICADSPMINIRSVENFSKDWKFNLGDNPGAEDISFDDSDWRQLDLPHDWSIEGEFNKDNPATPGGGALPGGIGWYRKSFILSENDKEKVVFIEFDGVYQKSEVWINNHYLGIRPYGYSSFRYELTPYLKFGNNENVIAVKVDNSLQPNSRWYTGSGIYRNVWLITTNKVHVDHWGTFITTPDVNAEEAVIKIQTRIKNSDMNDKKIVFRTIILNQNGNEIGEAESEGSIPKNDIRELVQKINIKKPELWSVEKPYLYKALTQIEVDGEIADDYETTFGVRTFHFDNKKGFILNGKQVKINGVCNHHDLGCLGTAVNERAIERQLEILKEMGVNGIRTSHNPPAPELLDLCDRMGFIVMDEAFDVWKKKKTEYDYSLFWDEWHKKDLEDLILRDRNHPSVFIWSIGNEVTEQWDKKDDIGFFITKELVSIVKGLDTTRPVTAACNDKDTLNPLIKSGALDLIGYNYDHNKFPFFPQIYPDESFIATETVSALATRGEYDMPSDSIRRWPKRWDLPLTDGNKDHTCSSYDNCSVPWGSTHFETMEVVKNYDFISGMFVWTGFDYLGEPTPYGWPSRSSYFGIIDLAGFPKDAYYLYKSEWTDEPVLHLFPHWNWTEGDSIDVWVYTNCQEVELYLNENSLGKKRKKVDDFQLVWRVEYHPGELKAIGRNDGKEILSKEVKTAGVPSKIILEADRNKIKADGKDLSFITVKIVDDNGTIVPDADNLINFQVEGEGDIAGVDNGLQTSHESFKTNFRKAFNGMCLVVIRSKNKKGNISLKATSDGLKSVDINIQVI